VREYGSVSDARKTEPIDEVPISSSTTIVGDSVEKEIKPKSGTRLMLDEERLTGEVKWSTYTRYLEAVGNWWWAVVICIALVTEQAATVGTSLMLGYWSDGKIAGFSQGGYMAVYAGEYCGNKWTPSG
jgi:ATP-binding cassette subfamily C (CFTR/MRP) protein 1